jgi:hypothetical protein
MDAATRTDLLTHASVDAIAAGAVSGPRANDLEPLLVKPKAAWRLINCSHSHGYKLLAAGELVSFKDGKSRKITMASIRGYIARQIEAAELASRASPGKAVDLDITRRLDQLQQGGA